MYGKSVHAMRVPRIWLSVQCWPGSFIFGIVFLLIIAPPTVQFAHAEWDVMSITSIVQQSDIIVEGRLQNVSLFTKDRIDFGRGTISVDRVYWGDTDSGQELTLAWQNSSDIVCPRVENEVNQGVSGIWLLTQNQDGTVSAEVAGNPVTISREDVSISAQSIEGWLVDSEAGLTVALDTALTPDLVNEGLAREFVNRVQNMRKDAGFDVTDRIRIQFQAPSRIAEAVEKLSTYVMSETLATQISQGTNGNATRMDIDGETCDITITRV